MPLSIAPLVFWKKEIREDSGGAGKYRGGHGQSIVIENRHDAPFEILAAFDRIDNAPRGRDGGNDGANGYVGLGSGKKLNGKGFQTIPAGDVFIVETPGGAGLGDPAQRDRAAIAADLRDGFVSAASAQRDYGVAAAGDD